MGKSKLELYEEILGTLVGAPLTIDDLAYKTDMDCTILQKHLLFLLKNGLIEERIVARRLLYALTERGFAVFKTLNFRKYLQTMSNALRAVDDAMQAIPIIARDSQETQKEQRSKKY